MKSKISTEERIEKLELRQKQNAARLARLKAVQKQTERKKDTRRKILIGAVVLKKAGENPNLAAQLIRLMDEGLTSRRDRALFPGLNPEPHTKK